MHSLRIKQKASQLRQAGRTHREIARELRIAIGTAYEWTKGMNLSRKQRVAVYKRNVARVWTEERRLAFSKASKIRLSQYQIPKKHTKESLVEKVVNFYKKNGRIPLKREFNMYKEYKREFGGWNRAIRTAGFNTNPELFAHKFKSSDGHSCDSFTEKIIDDWLLENEIVHQRNWHYGDTKMTADFFLDPDIVLEFFGLAGVQKKYDKIISRKRKFCERFGWKLVEIYPSDLFPRNCLPEKLSFLLRN